MVDYLKLVAEIEARMAAKSPPAPVEPTATGPEDTPAEDTPPAPVDTPAQDGDWRSAIPRDTMRRYIEKEQSTWTDERRQAQADEIQRIEAYRRQRGPRPSGPPAKLDRSEVFAAIGAVMERLGKIWPSGLDTDPQWQDKINAAAQTDRETFLTAIREWEASETKRVEEYMNTIRETVAGWPDPYRRRFALMVQGFMNKDRGYGLTVPALNPNQAQEKAFNDLLPHVPDDTPTESPTTDDNLPFHDLHPATREILLRSWNGWDAARRARFVQDVEDVVKRTGYSEGNACAFILQTAMSPEEEEALRGRMWPTPPSSPSQKTKPAVPGPDIAKIVSRWPKPLRMKYAGLVGQYSNSMPLVKAMARAYSELKDTAQEDGK